LKAKQKQPVLKKTSVQYKPDVYLKLQNASDITGQHDWQIIDQALRKFFGMPTPTIQEVIKKGDKIK